MVLVIQSHFLYYSRNLVGLVYAYCKICRPRHNALVAKVTRQYKSTWDIYVHVDRIPGQQTVVIMTLTHIFKTANQCGKRLEKLSKFILLDPNKWTSLCQVSSLEFTSTYLFHLLASELYTQIWVFSPGCWTGGHAPPPSQTTFFLYSTSREQYRELSPHHIMSYD